MGGKGNGARTIGTQVPPDRAKKTIANLAFFLSVHFPFKLSACINQSIEHKGLTGLTIAQAAKDI